MFAMSIQIMCYVRFMPRKAGPNEESRQRSRAQLLQAGADLLVDRALQNPFAALRLRRLCERAGLSTGAFYVHWATLEEYYEDLASYVMKEDEMKVRADFASLSDLAEKGAEQDILAAIAHLAERDLQLLLSNPLWDVIELMALSWGRTHFRDRLGRRYEAIDRSAGLVYGSTLAKRGREPRPPLDWDGIGAILQGLAEGLGLRYKIDPATVPPSSESASNLYASAVAAVLAVLTRPTDDDANTHDAIQSILNALLERFAACARRARYMISSPSPRVSGRGDR